MVFGRTMRLACVMIGVAGASPASADKIIGHWCPENGSQNLTVNSDTDVQFNGVSVTANVSRHHVDFAIPASQPNAGARLTADQLSDDELQVSIGAQSPEIWKPCKPVS